MDEYLKKVKEIADFHLKTFKDLGWAPAGNNGPYGDCDTPVRNTAHWCVTYAYLYSYFEHEQYRDILTVFSKYLMLDEHYGKSGAVVCRVDNNYDDTNGIIGQGWVIEGLVALYHVLKQESLLEKAVSIFMSQKFDAEKGLWKVCCSDGKVTGYDYVYNHQLWFAAAGSLILEEKDVPIIRQQIKGFLDHSSYTFGVQPSGKMYHLINPDKSSLGRLKFTIKKIFTELNIGEDFAGRNYVEQGYQLFDLYGFALLKNEFGNHPLFKSKKLKKAIKYGISPTFVLSLGGENIPINKYGYPYNSPAFEYPFVLLVLDEQVNEKLAKNLLSIQFEQFFDEEKKIFNKQNDDHNTLTARLYELVRYFNKVGENKC